MKIRLGNKRIKLKKIRCVHSVGNVVVLTLKNGETLKVVCGTRLPERRMLSFPGTVADLKTLIQRLK
ncbi:MAG: hypothetical protein OXC79_05490 [Candidatus Poribacteria bacterium]|nr:hypothetical protein [Candidatus Poribacteria bacterium]